MRKTKKILADFWQFLSRLENFLVDFVFPFHCLGCEKPGVIFCQECQKRIPFKSFQVCPFCEKTVTLRGEVCQLCKKESETFQKTCLEQLIVATSYNEKIIQRLIHVFKYNFVKSLDEALGDILAKSLLKNLDFVPDLIVPVPLHPLRHRWRGFNQSELLAQKIATQLSPPFEIPVEKELLKRTRYTLPQMKIKSQEERMSNLANAFALEKKLQEKVRSKKILLVDDVCTTGTTLFECSSLLADASAKKISAVVIARQGS